MRIAVINEVSACARNADIVKALGEFRNIRVYNVGMTEPTQEPILTYIQTGIMSAILLNLGISDLVVGGCGTGQGYLNSVMQFPGVFCGLITSPLDAWLFSQINAGNCISLALNKGYGWAGEINLRYIFREFLRDEPGAGYPPARSESQKQSCQTLKSVSEAAHRPMLEVLKLLDPALLRPIAGSRDFMVLLKEHKKNASVANVLEILEKD